MNTQLDVYEPLRYEKPLKDPYAWLHRTYDAALTIMVLILMVMGFSWLQTKDLEAQLADRNAEVTKYSALLAACMNGGTLYDQRSDTAHFCDKVVSVKHP